MKSTLRPWLLYRSLFHPNEVFDELAETDPEAPIVFFRYLIWFAMLPPLFAFIGASNSGWDLGAAEPLLIPTGGLVLISLCYFIALLFGLASVAVVSQWMAPTYGARHALGIHFALVTIVATPLVIGSAVHLYPHVFANILVLIPALIWSMYLLYVGLPRVLKVTPERGMLMASSLIGYLLVAVVSLLGITVALWGQGIGPSLGV